jgi:hypothetical protein
LVRNFCRRTPAKIANQNKIYRLLLHPEWPVLLQRAGFAIEYRTVDGLDWEIPDQFQSQAAAPERQAEVARTYDADPANWPTRMEVALEKKHD